MLIMTLWWKSVCTRPHHKKIAGIWYITHLKCLFKIYGMWYIAHQRRVM